MNFTISIDIGGTHIKAAIVSEQGKIYKFEKRFTGELNSKSKLLNEIRILIKKKLGEAENKISGIVIGSPGVIDPSKKYLISRAENLPEWNLIDFQKEIEAHFNMTLYVENDANLAALGEVYFNNKFQNKLISFITIGTGIGSALVQHGDIFYGSSFKAGEAGHMSIDLNGPVCHCGQKGCYELFVSSKALKAGFKEKFKQELSAKNIFSILFSKEKSKDEEKFLDDYFYALSIGLYNIDQIYNPEYFIIGGGISDCHSDFVKELGLYCEKNLNFRSGKIVKSVFGNDAALVGGIAIVNKK